MRVRVARGRLCCLIGAAVLCAAAPIVPHPDWPPTAHTGGFGEPTCIRCHQGEPLNAPGGRLGIEGRPDRWRPGATYLLTVVLRRDSLARAGFELAARFADGSQAGTLSPRDTALTTVTRDSVSGIRYAHHTRAGTRVANNEARWVIRWTAPAERHGAIVLHVAAVASNDDDSNLGDFVFTAAVSVAARR